MEESYLISLRRAFRGKGTAVSRFLPAALCTAALILGSAAAPGDETAAHPSNLEQVRMDQQVRPVIDEYCVPCHGARNPRAGLNLAKYATVLSIQRDQEAWRKSVARIHDGTMPPPGARDLRADQRERLTTWLTGTLDAAEDSLLPKSPGRVLIHRLTRLEYNNTVRDLFGITSKPADRFPADGGGGAGFDNNSDTLFLPAILMERYLQAAGEILAETRPERLFIVRPGKKLTAEEAARRTVAYHAGRAYRRPVQPGELGRLLRLYRIGVKRGASYEGAVRLALKAMLVSPNFLYRAETETSGETRPLNDYELASRLSYFLWASMPDDALMRLAQQKRLHDPAVLVREARRMLRDPRARAFAESFVGQWLHVRDLFTTVQPDPGTFPEYNQPLRDAMYQEPVELLYAVMRDNSDMRDLLNANYTFVNETLARHYGIAGITGPKMQRVALSDGRRGGVLTMAGVLTLTSYPQRTSPVLRGKWVLEEIFGTPPPPPPGVVATLPADDRPRDGLTFRQRLERHRAKPQCASCHNRLDPLGLGLENFDAIGRWRTQIAGQPVDASGTMATGEKFSGPQELKQQVLARKELFARNITEKMLAYALGRGLEPYDLVTVRKITAALKAGDYRSDTLIREIVASYPFRYRQNTR